MYKCTVYSSSQVITAELPQSRTSVAVDSSAGRIQGSNKTAIILKIFGDVDHLKRCLLLCQY